MGLMPGMGELSQMMGDVDAEGAAVHHRVANLDTRRESIAKDATGLSLEDSQQLPGEIHVVII